MYLRLFILLLKKNFQDTFPFLRKLNPIIEKSVLTSVLRPFFLVKNAGPKILKGPCSTIQHERKLGCWFDFPGRFFSSPFVAHPIPLTTTLISSHLINTTLRYLAKPFAFFWKISDAIVAPGRVVSELCPIRALFPFESGTRSCFGAMLMSMLRIGFAMEEVAEGWEGERFAGTVVDRCLCRRLVMLWFGLDVGWNWGFVCMEWVLAWRLNEDEGGGGKEVMIWIDRRKFERRSRGCF